MNNNMICDVETGICGPEEAEAIQTIHLQKTAQKLTLYYVTDPICSHCWALEPVLRHFLTAYGHYFHVETIMGGLLEKWDGFADVSNGISSPTDVAAHWREVGEHARMPIDGSVWLTNPIASSYPPSRVFKVIQQKNEELAVIFLRRIREAVFAFNQNIAEDAILMAIVNKLGLDGKAIMQEASQPSSHVLLQADFMKARNLGVRGFPTIMIVNEANKGVKIVGAQPFTAYVQALTQVLETEPVPSTLPSLAALLDKEGLLFSKELEELYGVAQQDIPSFIERALEPAQYGQQEILGEMYIKKQS